jgi:hypothetical protein
MCIKRHLGLAMIGGKYVKQVLIEDKAAITQEA